MKIMFGYSFFISLQILRSSKIVEFVILKKIVFSVVDEDFANCLAGLDSNLNN